MGGGKGRRGHGHGGGHGRGREDAARAHFLIENHRTFKRQVEMIENGVRTTTTTEDPELRAELVLHTREMKTLLESGGRIRRWDPLFVALFEHADEIEMTIAEVEEGVVVTETASNPEVAALIRAHAAKVDDFVARGQAAYDEATPLPDGIGQPPGEK
jgi:hypothetical protein